MNNLDVKKIREELRLTQQELADKLDSNIRTVQKWESGETNIRKSTAFMLNDLRNKGVSIKIATKKTPNLIKNGVEFNLKECAEYIAEHFKDAKKISKLFDLTVQNDNRDYLISYLTSKGFIVK